MSWYPDYPPSEHQVRLMVGDPVAEAWQWIMSYAESLGSDSEEGEVTADELVETAMSHVKSKSRWGGDYICKRGLLEGVSVDNTFWEKLAVLEGVEIPQDKRNNFFSCSC